MRLFDKKQFEINTEKVYLKSRPDSVIWMESVDKDPDKMRGGTHHYIHWSEVAFSKIEQGETITGVFDKIIQPTLTETDGYVLLESTNNGKNGWYDIWENAEQFGFKKLKFGLSDMVYMGLVSEEEYERIRKQTQVDVFRQEYECEWVSFQGKIYEELTNDMLRPVKPPDDKTTTLSGIDWGYDPSATCVLFSYVKDNVLYVYDEIYKKKQLAVDTAQNINEKVAEYQINRYLATADHEQDRIDELHKRGIMCKKANKVNMLGARISVKELMHQKRLVIDPVRCPYLVKDLTSAVWDVKKEGEIDYSQCTWGHFDAEAALRYLVRELSGYNEVEIEENPHDDDATRREWQLSRMRRYIDDGY